MALQARMEELLAKAFIIDGRMEKFFRFCSETKCVDKVEMSKASAKHSVSVAR